MAYLRLWWWVSYYDDTRILIEREITKRTQIQADRDIALEQLRAQVNQINAQKEILLTILRGYFEDRRAFFQQREMVIRSLLEQKKSSIDNCNQMLLEALRNNDLEHFKILSQQLLNLHSVNVLQDLQALETASSEEVVKMLGSGISKFLPSS